MAIIERHTSPDGLLQLVVDLADDGVLSVGFDGFAWHTHGDILDWSGCEGTAEERVRAFVTDVISSRRVIVISRMNGVLRDAWITDDPTHDELEFAEPGEAIEKRFWNGEQA